MRQLYPFIIRKLNILVYSLGFHTTKFPPFRHVLIRNQYSKPDELPFKKESLLRSLLVSAVMLMLFYNNAKAASITTANTGNWNLAATWNGGIVPVSTDNITVNHSLTLNTSITISGAGTLTFRANSSGTQFININSGTTGGLIIENNATVTVGNNSNFNGGTVIVRSGSTLNIGSIATSNAVILVETGGILNVTGTINNNGSLFTINGNMNVTGSYQGANANAHIEGSGEVTTTQSMTSMNGGSIFGVVNGSCTPASPALCYGRSLSSTCAGVTAASLTPAATNACSASAVTLSISYTGSGTISYQWQQRSSTSSVYAVISGATTASYNATPTATLTYYRVKVTSTNGNCFRYSNVASLLGGSAPVVEEITGSAALCKGSSATFSNVTANGTWSSGSASVATVSNTGIVSGISAGTSVISYTVTSGGCTTTKTKTITVNTCVNNWTGATSTNWNTGSNWSSGSAPIASDSVLVSSGPTNSPIISTSVNSGQITIGSGAALTISSGGILNVYGTISNSGTFNTVAGSAVSFNGSAAQTMTGVAVLYNVIINNTSGVSLSSAVTINGTLSLTKGVLTTNSNLTLDFDKGGNIGYASTDLGSVSGNVSGRRDVIAKTHYISAPFSGVTSAQVDATTPLFVNPYWKMYTKTFATQNWAAVVNATTAMPLGTGYSLSVPAAVPLILKGTYDHTFTLTGPAYSNTAANKYLMVGNPYPSTLDWSNASGWTKTNVGGAIYYWDAATNRVATYVNNTGTNGGTQYIPAMQSFLVETTGGGGTSSVSIANAARISQNASYFRVAQDDIIRVTLLSTTDSTYTDETVIRFNEAATNDFDYDLDAHKILNTGVMPSVYTTSKNETYSINSYASLDSKQYIPVGTKLPSDGQYKLKISGTNPNMDYILVDKLLGTEQRITTDNAYAFSGLKADDANRFELQLRESAVTVPTGIQSAAKNSGLDIYSSTKGFVIKTDRYAGEEAEIEILDMTGNSISVLSGKKLLIGSTYIPLDVAEGAYLIKVHVDADTFAGMIVLVK